MAAPLLIPLAIWAAGAGLTASAGVYTYYALQKTYEGATLQKIRQHLQIKNWPMERNIGEGQALQWFADYKALVDSSAIMPRISADTLLNAGKVIASKRNAELKDVVYVLQGLTTLSADDGEIYDYFQGTQTASQLKAQAVRSNVSTFVSGTSTGINKIFDTKKMLILLMLAGVGYYAFKKKILG